MLQPIIKRQLTCFKNSATLERKMKALNLPANASLFTYDAVSMYMNIDTENCIDCLSDSLLSPQTIKKFPHYPPEAIVEALNIVISNNCMCFGDILVKQLVGIAMGVSPAHSSPSHCQPICVSTQRTEPD